ncbi:hypothetical protein [Kineococcus sp. SYSU DK005]|uniref:hypothetical protein n=1 Tax=Kineococcus sp. SYSU DK005 TaxID=3383126 RepID=UPI003D7D3D88
MDEEPAGTGRTSHTTHAANARRAPRASHAVDALRQWLLTEDAFARGAATDAALNHQQDRTSALLGPHAVPTTHEHLRRHLARGGRIADLTGQPSQLRELLTLLRSTRRRGFEQQPSPAPKAQQDPRPSAVLVMAEHHGGEALRNRPHGDGGPVRSERCRHHFLRLLSTTAALRNTTAMTATNHSGNPSQTCRIEPPLQLTFPTAPALRLQWPYQVAAGGTDALVQRS